MCVATAVSGKIMNGGGRECPPKNWLHSYKYLCCKLFHYTVLYISNTVYCNIEMHVIYM